MQYLKEIEEPVLAVHGGAGAFGRTQKVPELLWLLAEVGAAFHLDPQDQQSIPRRLCTSMRYHRSCMINPNCSTSQRRTLLPRLLLTSPFRRQSQRHLSPSQLLQPFPHRMPPPRRLTRHPRSRTCSCRLKNMGEILAMQMLKKDWWRIQRRRLSWTDSSRRWTRTAHCDRPHQPGPHLDKELAEGAAGGAKHGDAEHGGAEDGAQPCVRPAGRAVTVGHSFAGAGLSARVGCGHALLRQVACGHSDPRQREPHREGGAERADRGTDDPGPGGVGVGAREQAVRVRLYSPQLFLEDA